MPTLNDPEFIHIQSRGPFLKNASDLKNIHGEPVLENLRQQIIHQNVPPTGYIRTTLIHKNKPEEFQIQYSYFPEWGLDYWH